jgi:hypothetical protein
MEGGGWAVFRPGTFKGNKSFYVVGALQSERPLWETCRAFLSQGGLSDTTASQEETWHTVVLWEDMGLWPHVHLPRGSYMEQVRDLFWAEP